VLSEECSDIWYDQKKSSNLWLNSKQWSGSFPIKHIIWDIPMRHYSNVFWLLWYFLHHCQLFI
jgi:hypothetical protein